VLIAVLNAHYDRCETQARRESRAPLPADRRRSAGGQQAAHELSPALLQLGLGHAQLAALEQHEFAHERAPHETLGGAVKLGITLETVIDRTQFGLEWNAPLPKGGFALADDVKLTVELELAREGE
jgi:hypothetical protein